MNTPPVTTLLPAAWLDTIVIRPAVRSDLPALEWEGEFSHFRRIFEQAYDRMLKHKAIIWLADFQGDIIGQVFIQLDCDRPELANGSDRAYLYSFRVRPAYRGRGLGSRMVAVVENDLRQRGYRTLTLNVARDNPRAQQLYQRLGFEITAPEPGFWSYPDQHGVWHQMEEPAWRMEKELQHTADSKHAGATEHPWNQI
ncbi:MAG TPA: GNAT family N-acetyltransferase [Anaerolineaceae bacterium]|nr:GNAT family N-acetyltransferase [Anaerolineaceae bacterium]